MSEEISLAELPTTWSWRIVKCGLTKKEVARKGKISPSALNNFTSGRRFPSMTIIIRVEELLAEYGSKTTFILE
jgi:transcriptional regulator with XRE-family HTH domain